MPYDQKSFDEQQERLRTSFTQAMLEHHARQPDYNQLLLHPPEDHVAVFSMASLLYFEIRRIGANGWCAISHQVFTVGLLVNIKPDYGGCYDYRYCYKHLADAVEAIRSWDGSGDAPGPWIKRKGIKNGIAGDIRNPQPAADE